MSGWCVNLIWRLIELSCPGRCPHFLGSRRGLWSCCSCQSQREAALTRWEHASRPAPHGSVTWRPSPRSKASAQLQGLHWVLGDWPGDVSLAGHREPCMLTRQRSNLCYISDLLNRFYRFWIQTYTLICLHLLMVSLYKPLEVWKCQHKTQWASIIHLPLLCSTTELWRELCIHDTVCFCYYMTCGLLFFF